MSKKRGSPRISIDDRDEAQALFSKLKEALPKLEELLEECIGKSEDRIYRFYHQSFKVYGLQELTLKIIEALQALAPGRPFNEWFMQIVKSGTGKRFEMDHNDRWLEETRPILEAFFHAQYFLEMAVYYGKELEHPPRMLPSGWAAFLYLFNLR